MYIHVRSGGTLILDRLVMVGLIHSYPTGDEGCFCCELEWAPVEERFKIHSNPLDVGLAKNGSRCFCCEGGLSRHLHDCHLWWGTHRVEVEGKAKHLNKHHPCSSQFSLFRVGACVTKELGKEEDATDQCIKRFMLAGLARKSAALHLR